MKKSILIIILLSISYFSFSQNDFFQGKFFEKVKFDALLLPVSFNKKMANDIYEMSYRISLDYMIKDKYALKLLGSSYFDLNMEQNTFELYETYGLGFGYFSKDKTVELTIQGGITYDNKLTGYYYDLGVKTYIGKFLYITSGINHQLYNDNPNLFSGYLGFGMRIF